jgi:hypothetical protein
LLLATTTTDRPEILVGRSGRVIARFDHRTQDSGNISWLDETPSGAFFVKTAGVPDAPPPGAYAHDRDARQETVSAFAEAWASASSV